MNKFNFFAHYLKLKPQVTSKKSLMSYHVNLIELNLLKILLQIELMLKWGKDGIMFVLFVNLFNRQIVGYYSGPNKTVDLVLQGFRNH